MTIVRMTNDRMAMLMLSTYVIRTFVIFFISTSTTASSSGVLMLSASHGWSTHRASTRSPAAFRTPGQSVR